MAAAVRVRVPVYAEIAAGRPVQGAQLLGYRSIRRPSRKGRHFIVKINGESLIGAGILPGDLAVCRATPCVEYAGQLCAVLTPDGLTLKYVWLEEACVRLESANSAYGPMLYELGEVSFQGVVVRIERDIR